MERKLKILVIVNAHFGYDGISNVATNYYRYQDKNKIQMDILTINQIPKKLENEILNDGNKHFVVSYRNSNPIRYIYTLKKIIKDNSYDIVHVHGNSATMTLELLAAKMGKCKVRIAHSHNTKCDHQLINRILKPIFSKLYTHCCACSKEAGKFLFDDRECYIVNNGIFLPVFEFNGKVRQSVRKKIGVEDEIVIGHIGRFSFQKNQEFLIKILKKMVENNENVVLLLVGEGEIFSEIVDYAASLGVEDKIIFYGTTDSVFEIVQAMDVFVFPSRFEGLGIVALEAQAAGLNCVASDEVPAKIKIMDETMFLSLQQDIDSWINAINKSIVMPSDREKEKGKIRKLFKKAGFDIENNCKDMLIYYNKILR